MPQVKIKKRDESEEEEKSCAMDLFNSKPTKPAMKTVIKIIK